MKKGLKRKPSPKPEVGNKPFKWNVGQQRVLDMLQGRQGKLIREILIAAGSRCFPAGTLVRTISGYVRIEELKAGDTVLSKNMTTGELEGQEILKTFKNKQGHRRKNVIFVLRDGTKIRCTAEHEIYQKDKTYRADTIARRALETGTWVRSEIPSEQSGEDTYSELEVYRRDPDNETGFGCQRVSPNDVEELKRGVFDSKGAQNSGESLGRKSEEISLRQPHKQRAGRQPFVELRMGDTRQEHGAHDGAGSAGFQQGSEKRNEQEDGNNGRYGSGDSKEIRSFNYETRGLGDVVWYNRIGVSRHNIPKALEARELDISDIEEIHFAYSLEATYDICVASNHNYLVSERNILVSNSGKTFLIVAALVTMAIKYPGSRHLIARKHFSHVKNSIWADTLPKVLTILFPEIKPHLYWNNTDYYLLFPNGSEIWIAGLDDKERVDKILGREYLNIFFNEASEIEYDTYLTVKTRLAQLIEGAINRIFVDENPPSSKHWTKILFVDRVDPEKRTAVRNPERYAFVQIHPWENAENISKEYLQMIEDLPANKRLRFYEGKFRDDAQFALWSSETINRNRVTQATLPVLKRIVVAVDPAVSSKDTSDETGIVVRGLGYNGHVYTLADATGTYTPSEWAKKTIQLYHDWKADEVVAEVNNGGDLVETVIRTAEGGKYISYKGVHATRDKLTRAEPVAALAEQGMDHHLGEFPELEEEMTTWEGKKGQKSPNRIDALVWGTFALIPEMGGFRREMSGNFREAMRMVGPW